MQTTVLTLAVDDIAQAHFDALRKTYYPPTRNKIGAHITLFHQLPLDSATEDTLQSIAARTPVFESTVGDLQFLGRGVAFRIVTEELNRIHAHLRNAFAAELIPQDKQTFRPHIVVQNKVTPEEAKRTMDALQDHKKLPCVQCVGLDWWEYLGGPWKHLKRFHFSR